MHENTNLDALIKRAADFVIANDRSIYAEYYKHAENYCAENAGVMLGGAIATTMMLKQNISHDLVIWDIYAPDALAASKGLADYLYKKSEPPHLDEEQRKYVAVGRDLAKKEYVVIVNTRPLFRIIRFSQDTRYSGQGWFTGRTIKYINPLITITDLCRTVYNLTMPNEATIDLICEIWDRRISSKKGGRREGASKKQSEFEPHEDFILCHDKLYMGGASNIAEVLEKMPKGATAHAVNPHMPGDFRLEWFYITKGDKKLMEWVNTGTYEIFPFAPGARMVAGPIVRLRFILIKMMRLESVADPSAKGINNIRAMLEADAADLIETEVRPKPDTLIPVDNYTGITTLEKVARNHINKKNGFWRPYYPAFDPQKIQGGLTQQV